MIKSIIPKILYNGYNLVTWGELKLFYEKVRHANSTQQLFDMQELTGYLEKWGFDGDIENNPLMDKADIKEWTQKVDPDDIHDWAYTGGSYGEPLRVPYSKERRMIRTATFKYFNEAAGYELGDPFYLIRAKNKSAFVKFLRNEHIFIPKNISESRIRDFIGELKSKKIRVLMGYPTVMYELALYLKRNPGEKEGLQIRSLISISEPLEEFKREIIRDVFDCIYIDRYSNEEVGLIAQQKEFGGPYYVNKFGVYVEVVDPETYQPVREGEQGVVVVTDIFNDLIPVIRYNTGDMATVQSYRDGQLLAIQNITGRAAEQILSSTGEPVSPLILGPYIYKPLSKVGPVFQYQFAQTASDRYELRIKSAEEEVPEGVLGEITEGLKSVLGPESEISTVFCDEIRALPSGKRPIYLNEMNRDHG
ncbi:MAG: hypothetical protein U5K69_18985 [Balneolaceae bacterium]|nr:hypothetical protein [Balneolaceae bacterium]